MPYRIDVTRPPSDAFERLVDLGALDVDRSGDGLAAILPDAVSLVAVRRALGAGVSMTCSAAMGRDAGSVWVLAPRAVLLGRVTVVPAGTSGPLGTLQLHDGPAFGTGLHPTTALCAEAIEAAIGDAPPGSLLDVGTGSGVLALAALMLGVPRAVGVDLDAGALHVAASNARLNSLQHRLRLVRGGPDALSGSWPLVVANVLAAPLIEMAPTLVRRVGGRGRLILSGIPAGVVRDVELAYTRRGMQRAGVSERGGWAALVCQASW